MGFGTTCAQAGDCWTEAARAYGLDARLMYVIGERESGLNATALNRNRDGSYDIGVMQINSHWLPILKRYGISEKRLFDRCTNESVGAWILARNIRRYGATWRAVGGYNAHSPDKQRTYARRIFAGYYGANASPAGLTPPSPFRLPGMAAIHPDDGGHLTDGRRTTASGHDAMNRRAKAPAFSGFPGPAVTLARARNAPQPHDDTDMSTTLAP
ncbi:lytic transglycosylase domain-containing protein [Robbsia sp. Bb-Pol-6]|uniref:Lytic transglycosylase domain-containing protein n=2 Tax=Robbsia betulipollinis TaxID=2981849 RepID=A0ABT3ZKY9_9BURK|nr:lytic transglycosylase domain-containing protein [Robbsia betulipollinis]MCY0387203.1 lytic transglycosylase domain-containing protein [Robbsia betulipollinis]